ncbi:MAG TPA: succinylglutamate-semialdehyde dehydrogenase [Tepidisphaeraceae bacterium]|nr:succinylglutamate-semialdehyde dehydrogenase [Tepidisphaeraceae bacterium]
MSPNFPAIDAAVSAARAAMHDWAGTAQSRRNELVQAVADGYKKRKPDLIDIICRQTGKPRWEAATEVDAMIGKAAISISSHAERCRPTTRQIGETTASLRFRPVGVLAVLGPFNLPGHLPNGHLMPAVLAGNTVVFKPSELTPLVGDIMSEIWSAAGFPPGVFNLIQGGGDVGAALAKHTGVDGVLFTGSRKAGGAIHHSLSDQPEKLLALEMGGNNPLVVWDCQNLEAAAWVIVQSAYITSGQRCSCARRLILRRDDLLIDRLVETIHGIRIGLYTDDPEPFMGPVISEKAAEAILRAQQYLLDRGAHALVETRADPRSPALLSPGLIDVTTAPPVDEEIFGPLLQVIRVSDFDAALNEANRTRYGLCAGLISDRPELYERFAKSIRAGVVNFNTPLTGARSDLPFGGVGSSGNHRPSAYFAVDYCRDPVASLESAHVSLPATLPAGLATSLSIAR